MMISFLIGLGLLMLVGLLYLIVVRLDEVDFMARNTKLRYGHIMDDFSGFTTTTDKTLRKHQDKISYLEREAHDVLDLLSLQNKINLDRADQLNSLEAKLSKRTKK